MKHLITIVFLLFISVFVTEGSLGQLQKEKKSVGEKGTKAIKGTQLAHLNVAGFDKESQARR